MASARQRADERRAARLRPALRPAAAVVRRTRRCAPSCGCARRSSSLRAWSTAACMRRWPSRWRRWRQRSRYYGQGEMAMGLSNSTSFLRPITEGTVHALANAHPPRPHDVGVGRALQRRRRPRRARLTRMTIAVRPVRPAMRRRCPSRRPASERGAGAGVPARAGACRRSRCRAARAGSGAPGAPGSLIGTAARAAARASEAVSA